MNLSQAAIQAAMTTENRDSAGYEWAHIFATWNPELRFKGFRSYPHPSTLGMGEAVLARNNRCAPFEQMKRRLGTSTAVAGTTGLSAGTFQGASDYHDDGTYVHQLLAWKHNSDSLIHIWHRKYTKSGGTWGNWAELTASSGKFGDTRLGASPKNGRVQFTWLTVPADDQTLTVNYHNFKDATVCYVTDGNSVRIVDLDVVLNGPELGSSDTGLAHANAIPPPKGNIGVVWDAFDWLALRTAAATATGAATADWLSITVAAAPRTWTFVTAATIAGGDAANVIFDTEEITFATYTSDTDYVLPKQVILIAHSDKDSFWKTTTVSFRWKTSGGAYAWKAFDTAPLVLPTNKTGYEMIVLELPDLLPEQAADLLMNGLQFTTTSLTPASCTVVVYGFGVGGVVPGGTEYGIARRCRTSHVMSPGVVCGLTGFGVVKSEGRTENTGLVNFTEEEDFGGIMSSTVYSHATLPQGFILPFDSRVFYTPTVKFSNPHTGELSDNAADYVCFYRKEPRDRHFYRVERYAAASYGGGAWSLTSGTAGSTLSYVDTVASEYREWADIMPDEACMPPPVALAAGRFGARAVYLADNNGDCRVRISEHNQPLRCVVGVDQTPDGRDGYTLTVPREKGRAVAQNVSGTINADTFLFTDESVWQLQRSTDGLVMFNLTRVSALGCCSGESVAQMDGSLCWLDKNRDFRVLGVDEGLARFVVSEFDSIPDAYIGVTDCKFLKGRAYLPIVASGGTAPTQVMVFNFRGGYWESLDTFDSSVVEPEQLFEWRVDGAIKLYYIGADGGIYEYEKSGQYSDASVAISWALESKEFANPASPNWEQVSVRRMGIVCLDATSNTVTTTRTVTSPAATVTGTMSVDVTTAYAWIEDRKTGATAQEAPAADGNGVRLKWECSGTVQFEAFALMAQMKGLTTGGRSG